MSALLKTALHDLHVELGARMVPFAGYSMPVQYPMGVLKEHLHTRSAAGLFDVSHMGQLMLSGEHAAHALETLVPVDICELAPGQQRYALFTNDAGGILDDLMVCNTGEALFVVVNAGCKIDDIAHLRAHIGAHCDIAEMPEHALLALQGPKAAQVLARLLPEVDMTRWTFMTGRALTVAGAPCFITRSGYSGEDGFEISVPNTAALPLARALLADPDVAPIGLGARDSLRLEAGLCLYGHDLEVATTPIEAALTWAISKARRADGARPGGFPGAAIILDQIASGVARKRVGLVGLDRTPVREGAPLVDASDKPIGHVTSGGFGPTFGGPIAMGYVDAAFMKPDTNVFALVRGKSVAMRVAKTPFVAQRYYRSPAP